MSGIEILGSVAAAAQLVGLVINIVETLSKIRERVRRAPEQYNEYLVQTHQLLVTSELIQASEALQTEEIKIQLVDAIAEAEKLQSILVIAAQRFARNPVKQTFWRVVKGHEERLISSHFANLLQLKTTLVLSISTINATQMTTVQYTIEELAHILGSINKTQLPDLHESLQKLSSVIAGKNEESEFKIQPLCLLPSIRKEMDTDAPKQGSCSSYSQISIRATHAVTLGNSSDDQTMETGMGKPIAGSHTYEDIKAYGTNEFHAGNTGPWSSAGHRYHKLDVVGSAKAHFGDFNSATAKKRAMSQ